MTQAFFCKIINVMFYIVGLGNPTQEYKNTRHNVGREIVEKFIKELNLENLELNKKHNALVSEGKVAREKVMAILPETFMNKSGLALKKIITNTKKAKDLIVVHDDIDLPLGRAKIVFGKKSAGHKGVESVIRSIQTKEFIRIKIGISAVTPSGKIKKPKGQDGVVKHVLGKFSAKEQLSLKKIQKKTVGAIEQIISDGYLRAMNGFN